MYLLAASLVGLSVGVVAWGLTSDVDAPLDTSDAAAPTGDRQADPRPSSGGLIAPGRDFSAHELGQLASTDLRRPLFDPPKPAPPPKADKPRSTPKRPMTVQLVGTIHKPSAPLAVLRIPRGGQALCAVGESVDDVGGKVTVKRIERFKVVVEYADETRELTIDPPGPPGLVLFNR